MNSDSKQKLLRYLFAVGSLLLACLIWFALTPLIGNRFSLGYILLAILVTGRFAGFGPSWLALALGGVFVAYVQSLKLGLHNPALPEIIVIYFVLGTILVLLTHSERVARHAANTNAQRLKQQLDERTLLEAGLRDAEERFRLIATQAPIGISQGDFDGRVFFVNPALCQLSGSKPEEVMGFGWWQFIHPDDLEHLKEMGQADVAARKTSTSSTFRFIRKDGSIRWASSTSAIVHDASGRATGQVSITEDITDRTNAETALRTKESQLRGIIDNTLSVIYLKDVQGRYILTNRRHQTLFETHGASVLGKTSRELYPESMARKLVEDDAKVIEAKCPLVFEEVVPQEDGPHTYRSVKFPVTNGVGEIIAVGGISTDISDLTEAHEALEKKEKLLRNLIEVQEKEKQFLCNEFHDGLIQYAAGSLMSLESIQGKQDAAADASAILERAISNLRKGVDDGRRTIRGIRPAVLDDSTMEAALNDLIDQFPTSEIMVKCDCDPKIGRLPNAVQTTVYRLVQESLNNAWKHSGTDVVRISLRRSNGDLYLEVRDFGCGFDVKSHTRGFGLLGMTERVRLLGGECSIDSEKDAGTTIKVRLPIGAE